jgi:hypothetical protein
MTAGPSRVHRGLWRQKVRSKLSETFVTGTLPFRSLSCALAASSCGCSVASSRCLYSVQSSWCWHEGSQGDYLVDGPSLNAARAPGKGLTAVS